MNRTVLQGMIIAGLLTAASTARAQDAPIDDPSISDQNIAATALDPDMVNGQLQAIMPQTITTETTIAAIPAPAPTADYPLGARHWDELTPDGKRAVAGIMVDGLRFSGTFNRCGAIDGEAMDAGITEWMKSGDRTEAVMSVVAFIAYSVCPMNVPQP